VSRNTALIELRVWGNQLTTLDVSHNTALELLSVWGNQLTELDVSRNTSLEVLDIGQNQLTELDVSRNPALEFLNASENQLTELDVSRNTVLIELHVWGNQLVELDVSRNTAYVDNGTAVVLDGHTLSFDVSAQMIGGRTMLPLRAIFEQMGADVEWNAATQTATATKGGTVVVLTVGSVSPTVNGVVVPIDQPGIIIDGRTLAPLRFVAEAFGGTVEWDAATQTATITTG